MTDPNLPTRGDCWAHKVLDTSAVGTLTNMVVILGIDDDTDEVVFQDFLQRVLVKPVVEFVDQYELALRQ